jgi:hypothetical protein
MRCRRIVILGAALALCCAAACSRQLSRGRAKDLIAESEKFKEPMTAKVPVGKLWFDYRNVYDAYPLHELEKARLVTVFETGRTEGMWTKEYAVRLTPDGERDRPNWKMTDEKVNSWFAPPSPDVVIYAIPVARRKLDSVTGIHPETASTGDTEVVEFAWHWELSEAGRTLPRSPDSGAHQAQALFQRYDDGWRMTGTSFD